jgi:hypothetical protein
MLAESDVQPVGSCASEPAAIGSTATATGDVTTTHRIIEKGVRKLAPDDNMYKMLLCSDAIEYRFTRPMHLLLHKRLRPPYHLLVHCPRQRTTDRLPPNPQTQACKHAPHALLPQHHPRRLNHIPIPRRHKLQARLDCIKRIRDRRRRHCRHNARHKIRPRCARRRRHMQRFGAPLYHRRCLLQLAQLHLRPLVHEHVQARVRRVTHGRCAEAREKAAETFLCENVFGRAGERGVGVKRAFVADFENCDGVHDEASCDAGGGAGGEVGDVAEFRKHGGGIVGGAAAACEACCDREGGQAGGVGAHAV